MAPKTARSARSCSAVMSAGRFATSTTRRPGAQERKKKFGTKKEKYRRKKYNVKYCAGPGERLRGASACRSGCPGWWRWPATATIWGYGYIVSDTTCLHLLSSHGQGSLPAQQLENKEHAKRPCWAVGNVAVLQKKKESAEADVCLKRKQCRQAHRAHPRRRPIQGDAAS